MREQKTSLLSPEVLLVPVLPDPEVWCTDFIRLRVRRHTKLIWAQLFMSFSFLSLSLAPSMHPSFCCGVRITHLLYNTGLLLTHTPGHSYTLVIHVSQQ